MDTGTVDILTAQADITLYIRNELTYQVNAFTWRPQENGEYELQLFRGDQARSVHLSKSMLQKYGNKKWDKRIHMKIEETLKS